MGAVSTVGFKLDIVIYIIGLNKTLGWCHALHC